MYGELITIKLRLSEFNLSVLLGKIIYSERVKSTSISLGNSTNIAIIPVSPKEMG